MHKQMCSAAISTAQRARIKSMAGRDKLGVGSAVSLQAAGGEAIPREYHRKVMKKIAQLTKVIYTLNTKNDLHEEIVQRLRSLHESEMQKVLSDSAARMKRAEASVVNERESMARREQRLAKQVDDLKLEKRQLREEQESYRSSVSEHLKTLKLEHASHTAQLGREAESIKRTQSDQLREVAELRESISQKAGRQLAALKSQHEKQLADSEGKAERDRHKLEAEVASCQRTHATELSQLKDLHRTELKSLNNSHDKAQSDLVSHETRKWEEREASLRRELASGEEELKQRISALSAELREARDGLAMSEQQFRELEAHCEVSKADSSGAKGQLAQAEAEAKQLRQELGSLGTELEISREQYRQQGAEMQTMSANLGRLEAVRVTSKGEIEDLKMQVSQLQRTIASLERERGALQSSQTSANESQAKRLKSLHQEIAVLAREKEELHAQYAREIEAAHAMLGERESELGSQHIAALKEVQAQHQKALVEAHTDHRASLEGLREELEHSARAKLGAEQACHGEELARLQQLVSVKTSELAGVEAVLKRLRESVSEKEKGLGSASEVIQKLERRLEEREGEAGELRERLEALERENGQLKTSMESMQSRHSQALLKHRAELQNLRDSLTKELEQKWIQRIKEESASIRAELSLRHGEDSKAALAELALLKDKALREARDKWEQQRDHLSRKVDDLERQVRDVQQSANASLTSTRATTEEQLAALRKELEEVRGAHMAAEERAGQTYRHHLQAQQKEYEGKMKFQREEQLSVHRAELQAVQQANTIAVQALRDQQRREMRAEQDRVAEEHTREKDTLRAELMVRHDSDLSQVKRKHETELQTLLRKIEDMNKSRDKELSSHESQVGALSGEMRRREEELAKLRDRANQLTGLLDSARKELEVRGQEVASVKREASSHIRLREQQLLSAHQAELESISSQHKHQSHMLLTDFNRAKEILNTKLADLQKQLAEFEHRYHSRDSRPEDVEAIRELREVVRGQERRMKELVAEKRIYELELKNREKNYNQVFSVHPHVGVLNPLQFKSKGSGVSGAQRHGSAPSLVSPSPEPPPLATAAEDAGIGRTRQPWERELVPRAHPVRHASSSGDVRPRKLVTLHDSPLTQHKSLSRPSLRSPGPVGSRSASLQPAPPSSSPPHKRSMPVH